MTRAANKLVYLFELDSVRASPMQINAGLQALYDEIVVNGNTVVLTFNQIADSALFYELMNKARREEAGETFENLVRLFQNGALKISQFATTRTIVQFLIDKLDSDSFVYSAWPMKSSQPKLCALIKRSLETCDLSELAYFKKDDVPADELRGLFYDTGEKARKKSGGNLPKESLASLHEKIDMIYWLVRFVLRISIIPDIYLPPKAEIDDAFKMRALLKFVVENNIDPAVNALASLPAYIEGDNTRSAYESDIDELVAQGCSEETACKIKLMVDLCYNYASERSIFGISLHYGCPDGKKDAPGEDFLQDFTARFADELAQFEKDDARKARASRDEKSYKAADPGAIAFPDLAGAVAASRLSHKKHKGDFQNKEHVSVETYERGFAEAKKRHRKNLFGGFFSRILLLLLCLFIAVCLDFSTGALEEAVSSSIPFSDIVTVMLETLLFLLVSEYITVWLSKRIPHFVSLSEAIAEVVVAGKNAFRTFRSACTHINTAGTASPTSPTNVRESREDAAKLWFPTISKSLKRSRSAWEGKFTEGELAHYEEVSNKKLGLVYSSEYHDFYVDPVGRAERKAAPADKKAAPADNAAVTGFYERLENRNAGAVVVIPVHEGKFVFLKQFRHSISGEAYSLPRGFGEKGVSAAKNVAKELGEELHTDVLGTPVHLGRCYPDTGIMGAYAEVFLAEVGKCRVEPGYEGIRDIAFVAPGDVEELMVKDSPSAPFELHDGFSLCALALLHAKLASANLSLEQLLGDA